MQIERFDYQNIALFGFDAYIRKIFPPNEYLAIGCHKGIRRSRIAAAMLFQTGYPVANNLRKNPSVCYADFLNYNFSVSDEGLTIPEKIDSPCRYLLLFHDGGQEEVQQIRKIGKILAVEARDVLERIAFANVRDEGSLLSIA